MSKFVSRKLIATLLCVGAVVASELLGSPLDQATLGAVTNMLLGLVGAQGLVDTAQAWKTGKSVAVAATAAHALAGSTQAEPDANS